MSAATTILLKSSNYSLAKLQYYSAHWPIVLTPQHVSLSTTTLSIVGFSPPPGFCSSAKSAPVWRTALLSWIIAVGVPNNFKLGISLFLP